MLVFRDQIFRSNRRLFLISGSEEEEECVVSSQPRKICWEMRSGFRQEARIPITQLNRFLLHLHSCIHNAESRPSSSSSAARES